MFDVLETQIVEDFIGGNHRKLIIHSKVSILAINVKCFYSKP